MLRKIRSRDNLYVVAIQNIFMELEHPLTNGRLATLRPFQQYFNHIRTIGEWQ